MVDKFDADVASEDKLISVMTAKAFPVDEHDLEPRGTRRVNLMEVPLQGLVALHWGETRMCSLLFNINASAIWPAI